MENLQNGQLNNLNNLNRKNSFKRVFQNITPKSPIKHKFGKFNLCEPSEFYMRKRLEKVLTSITKCSELDYKILFKTKKQKLKSAGKLSAEASEICEMLSSIVIEDDNKKKYCLHLVIYLEFLENYKECLKWFKSLKNYAEDGFQVWKVETSSSDKDFKVFYNK